MAKKSENFIRRRRYLVSRLQIKYAGLILGVAFCVAIMCSYVVYYSSMLIMGDKLARVYPQGMLVGIVNTVNTRILLSLLLVSPLIILIGILVSHRIAGPVYRIQRSLGTIAAGDLSLSIRLRKGDEMKDLADGVNSLIEQLRANVEEEKTAINSVHEEVKKLKKMVSTQCVGQDQLNNILTQLDQGMTRLNTKIERYKT